MPLIFTPECIIAVAVALIVTLVAKRAGLPRRLLWLLATVIMIASLWLFGIHPLGFAVSWGGWIMFLLTVLIGRLIERISSAATRKSLLLMMKSKMLTSNRFC
jgi:uncharacterized membrane protein